jgi:hypothetical protein
LFDLKCAAWAARLTDLEDQTTGHRLNLSMQSLNRRLSFNNNVQASSPFPVLQNSPLSTDSQYFSPTAPKLRAVANLPYFIKPLPSRIGPEEVAYLEMKGVLTVPSTALRNELLRAYIEFVHPYMPLLDLYDFLLIIESENGALGRVSLILYQAIMFAGSAFVEMHYLHSAGYSSRKQARKDFFQKTRVSCTSSSEKVHDDSGCLSAYSFFTSLTMNLIAYPSFRLFCYLRIIMKPQMTKRIPGIGWALPPLLLIPLGCIGIQSGQLWMRSELNFGSGYGGPPS